MVLNVAARRFPPAFVLLAACAAGAALVQLVLARAAPGSPPANAHGFSPIFWYLLSAYDAHGNLLLIGIAVAAFLLRGQPMAGLVRFASQHPWRIAAVALPLFCAGALTVYRAYPLSMDEYVAVFQAETFAAGHLSGRFPPELLGELMPRLPPGFFLVASRVTGEVSATYWPGFALLLTPFAWLGIPWAANPAISALTLPAVHRLALAISGSREAAGWALLLTLASPVFVVSALSFYSMPAHLLCSLVYALLLLKPTVRRALLAGLVGSLALMLHNPAPHLLFAAAYGIWLLWRRTPIPVLAALIAGYVPLVLLLGYGWMQHLAAVTATAPAAAAAAQAAPAAAPSVFERIGAIVGSALTLPGARVVEARIAGLAKVWTWAAAALLPLAAWGWSVVRRRAEARAPADLLAAAFVISFLGYFFVPFDQGHGWGYRYVHAVWFALPVLAGAALAQLADDDAGRALRAMAAWCALLSLVLANGLRIAQVDAFLARQLAQVPPLAATRAPDEPQVLFISPTAGFYTRDLVHNDPFLRGARTTLVYDGPEKAAALMAKAYPGFTRRESGPWGELWTR
jgi:hypothetical protein